MIIFLYTNITTSIVHFFFPFFENCCTQQVLISLNEMLKFTIHLKPCKSIFSLLMLIPLSSFMIYCPSGKKRKKKNSLTKSPFSNSLSIQGTNRRWTELSLKQETDHLSTLSISKLPKYQQRPKLIPVPSK